MDYLIIDQIFSLSVYFITGIIIGIFFDIFRILRRTFNTYDLIIYLEDIIFWVITGLLLIYVIFVFSNGEIRIYNLFGLIIGTILYIIMISKKFIKINVNVLIFIKKITCKIFNIFFSPFIFLIKKLKRIIIKIRFKNKKQQNNINNKKNLKNLKIKKDFRV